MPDATTITRCRACDGSTLGPIIDLGSQPLANAYPQQPTGDQPQFPLELVRCATCGLVQITVTVDPAILFADYPYVSSYADAVVENANSIVESTVAGKSLGAGHLAVEIASNDGYLLQHYVKHGVPVLGIEPAGNLATMAEDRGVTTIVEFFGRDLGSQLAQKGTVADVIHANNVIAHVPDLPGVLDGITSLLAPEGVAIFETPWLLHMIEQLEFDTIYHEHLFNWSLQAFERALASAGLVVMDVEELPIHGGSLRISATHAASAVPSHRIDTFREREAAAGIHDGSFVPEFAKRVDHLRAQLRHFVAAEADAGRTIAAYGAAAKGTVLLHSCDIDPTLIEFVVDRNPLKQGRYMPGTAIPILDVAALRDRTPDLCLLFAWNHASEIARQQHEYLEAGGAFVVPFPEPTVLS